MIRRILILLLLVCTTTSVVAQFSISKVKPSSVDPMLIDSVKQSNIYNEYFSEARWQAERRKIRKERNFVEFNSSLQIAQAQFDNWAAGGDNTFSGRSTIFFRHQYKKEKFTVDYDFSARYGINLIDSKIFKNEDEFKFKVFTSWKIKHSWSYSASVNLRSQFSKGFKSRTDRTLMSNFMAPGFLDITIGFTYQHKDSPFKLTISPMSGNITTVLYKELSDRGINGVEKGKRSKQSVGPSVRAEFDKEFYKKIFRYRSTIYSYTDMKTAPTARWENLFEIRATKFLTTTITAIGYYDKYANTPKSRKLQLQYAFSIGLAYTFKNK